MADDLTRLGDALTRAVARRLAVRRRRRRLATAGAVGALAFAVLTPAALGPAARAPLGALPAAAEHAASPRCDQPHGDGLALRACLASVRGAIALEHRY